MIKFDDNSFVFNTTEINYHSSLGEVKRGMIGDYKRKVIPLFALKFPVLRSSYKLGIQEKITGEKVVSLTCEEHTRFRYGMSKVLNFVNASPYFHDLLQSTLPEWFIIKTVETFLQRVSAKSGSYSGRTELDTMSDRELKGCFANAIYYCKESYNQLIGNFNHTEYIAPAHKTGWFSYWKWASLISHFHDSDMTVFAGMRTRLPNTQYFVGRGYIAHINTQTNVVTPLVCLVTQSKYAHLLTTYMVDKKPVSSKYLQLWVKEDFDVPRTAYRNLRPQYRKHIKKPMEELGIKTVTVPSLSILFKKFHGVKCESLNEYKEFLSSSSEEIMSHLKTEKGYPIAEINN